MLASKRQNGLRSSKKRRLDHYHDLDPVEIAAIHFVKNLKIKPEPLAQESRISSISDNLLYSMKKQLEVTNKAKTFFFSGLERSIVDQIILVQSKSFPDM